MVTRRRKTIRRQPTTTRASVYDDWSCPVDPAHGRLLDYDNGRIGYCPHHACNQAGRRNIWTPDQLREAREKTA